MALLRLDWCLQTLNSETRSSVLFTFFIVFVGVSMKVACVSYAWILLLLQSITLDIKKNVVFWVTVNSRFHAISAYEAGFLQKSPSDDMLVIALFTVFGTIIGKLLLLSFNFHRRTLLRNIYLIRRDREFEYIQNKIRAVEENEDEENKTKEKKKRSNKGTKDGPQSSKTDLSHSSPIATRNRFQLLQSLK